jgi:uncharacterized membrane protein
MNARMPVPGRRREYLDWIRGVGVLLMIAAHLLDSWTRAPDRETDIYRIAMLLAGTGSVLFLVLAGVAVALSAGSKLRRSGDPASAATAVTRRGLQIFALAFLFRLQAWFLGWSHDPRDLLKVDILNVMGPSIVMTAMLWRMARSISGRCVLFALSTAAVALVTPVLRTIPLSSLPDPIEAYIIPVPGLSNFVFFPWMGFVFSGALMGVVIDRATNVDTEKRVNLWLAGSGLILVGLASIGSMLPSPLHSHFWTTSPSYFFIRIGLVAVAVGLAYAWTHAELNRRFTVDPIVQLGRTSLFIYWIHVELVYGLISYPIHHWLTLPQACVAYVLFAALMLACSVWKDRLVSRYGDRIPLVRCAAVRNEISPATRR